MTIKEIVGLKFKVPPAGSIELDALYDVLFDADTFFAAWAGRVGHYAYGTAGQRAEDADGYIYLYNYPIVPGVDNWRITASPGCAHIFAKRFIEICI